MENVHLLPGIAKNSWGQDEVEGRRTVLKMVQFQEPVIGEERFKVRYHNSQPVVLL